MKYTDVVWDFDGTLFDSYPHMIRSFRQALATCGILDRDETLESLIVISVGHAVRYYQDVYHAPDDLIDRYRRIERIIDTSAIRSFSGIPDVLQFISASGRRNHLFTHRDASALPYLEHDHLDQYFSELVTAEKGFALKPSPDAIRHIISLYGIEPGQLLMVGDRSIDLESAKNAGADSCFFNTNHLPVPVSADYQLTSIEGLRDIL